MTNSITDARLAEMEARCNAATPGPWRQSGKGENLGTHVSSLDHNHGYQIHSMEWVKRDGDNGPDVYKNMLPVYIRDATFIANAREDMPALIAEVRRLREALTVVRWANVPDNVAQMIDAVLEGGAE